MQAKKACNERTNKNIGPSEAAQRISGLLFFVETPLKRPAVSAVNWPKRFQAMWKEFLGMQSTLGWLEGIKNPPSVQTWNLWFLGGGFNDLFQFTTTLGIQTFDAYVFRWVEPTRFALDLRWLVTADFKPLWYTMGFSCIWGICHAFSRHLKCSLWCP